MLSNINGKKAVLSMRRGGGRLTKGATGAGDILTETAILTVARLLLITTVYINISKTNIIFAFPKPTSSSHFQNQHHLRISKTNTIFAFPKPTSSSHFQNQHHLRISKTNIIFAFPKPTSSSHFQNQHHLRISKTNNSYSSCNYNLKL